MSDAAAASSGDGIPEEHEASLPPTKVLNSDDKELTPTRIRDTINLVRSTSAESEYQQGQQPTHQFIPYPSSVYDSDGSDGSVVFNYPPSPLTPAQEQPPHHHQPPLLDNLTRFPSFDSIASTGSFRVIGANSSVISTSPYKNMPSPAVPQQTPVQLLPYDQRRKLSQQRQQEQQQQTQPQQQQPDMTPFPIPSHHQPPTYLMAQPPPYGMPNPHQQRHMAPYPIDPNQYAMPYVMTAGPIPMGPPTQMPQPPIAQQPLLSRPTTTTGTTTANCSKTSPPSASVTNQQQRETTGNKMSLPPSGEAKRKPQLHHSLPPSGHHARTYSGGAGNQNYASRSRASSADSMEAPPRPKRRADDGAPPPPPPPPPPNPYHIRADSAGSVSSLDSTGSLVRGPSLVDKLGNDIAGYLDCEQEQPSAQQPFFGFLGFSPTQQRHDGQQPQRRVSVEEFHQRNQEFLQQSEYARSKIQQAMRHNSPHRSPRGPQAHRSGLSSIDNDDWEEEPDDRPAHRGRTSKHKSRERERDSRRQQKQQPRSSDPYHVHLGPPHEQRTRSSRGRDRDRRDRTRFVDRSTRAGEASSDSVMSSSFEESDEGSSVVNGVDAGSEEEATERTSLLPPPGISTHEHREVKPVYNEHRRDRDRHRSNDHRDSHRSSRHHDQEMYAYELEQYDPQIVENMRSDKATHQESHGYHRRKKGRKSDRRRSRSRRYYPDEEDPDFSRSSSSSSYRDASRRQLKKLEKERASLIAQWKMEAMAEAEAARVYDETHGWDKRFSRQLERSSTPWIAPWMKLWIKLETFVSNLPLTVGAIALAIVTLEFPGCFYCDTTARMYKIAVDFHFACSAFAGFLALLFVAKVLLATRVVLDEMSSPTTASPAGLLCMTTVCVFAGRGFIGQVLVSAAAALHLCLAVWFIYMALAYHIMPEPSWFPNTVGIGLSAVKTWLYYPMPGHLLMAISLSLNFFFFPISLLRVTLNKKMSAPVCWIQMSAPAVSLYALTIMAQPSFVEEHPDVTDFQRVHRMVYLPCMHALFGLACIGLLSSVQSLVTRWSSFRTKAFSPAHAAFCFPTLAHANAIQAYRAAVNSFSDIPARSPFKIALYIYWVSVLVSGTVVTIYITTKFFHHLPSWTQVDVIDEEEPPAPNETSLTLQHMVTTGDTLSQPFVSPAILQANETGALVMLPSRGADGRKRYRRTRRLTALGFEPIMNVIEMDNEREVLLDWVGNNPPRRRRQTLSVPGIDFNYGFGDFGIGNTGVYGDEAARLSRSNTAHFPAERQRSRTYGGY